MRKTQGFIQSWFGGERCGKGNIRGAFTTVEDGGEEGRFARLRGLKGWVVRTLVYTEVIMEVV